MGFSDSCRLELERQLVSVFLPNAKAERSCPIWWLWQGIWTGKRQLALAGGRWQMRYLSSRAGVSLPRAHTVS